MLDSQQEEILKKLRDADGRDFATLSRIAGLDPRRDFREADLRAVDFGNADLRGFDFTGADLSGARLDRARTEGAIFEKAVTGDVIWPARRTNARRLSSSSSNHELSPIQLEVVRRLQAALSVPHGGLVSMPAGTGRAAIVERLLFELHEEQRHFNVLIAVERAAERDQYLARLSKLMPRRFTPNPESAHEKLAGLTVELATVGAITHAFRNQEDAALRLREIGLIILICDSGHLLTTAQLMKRSSMNTPIVGFTTLPDAGGTLQLEHQRRELNDVFGDFLYVLGVDVAVANGLLVEAIVEHRQRAPAELALWASEGLLSDLTYQIAERSRSTQCLIICKNIEAVDFMAAQLSDRFSGISRKRVFGISSRSTQPEFWAAVDNQDVVLVMTPAMATASMEQAIWKSGLTAVLTRVGPTLAERLRFRPNRADGSRSIILDYSHSIT